MKTLVIVDCQNDFAIANGGTLYVPKAGIAIAHIIDKLRNDKEINEVVFTLDWHPIDHVSFKPNGGIWPVHCLQYTWGAALVNGLIETCIENNISYKIFLKGNNAKTEEYGAFTHFGEYQFAWVDEGNADSKWATLTVFGNNASLNSFLTFKNIDREVCGLAGDYCVMETIKNIIKEKTANVTAYGKGIASIDGGTAFAEFCKTNNIQIV